jgi:nucleoside 2-deoxyribosyltransferase
MKFYIAAPFFNDVQLGAVKALELIIEEHGHQYHSPRLHPRNAGASKLEKLTQDQAEEIFQDDVKGIVHSNAVIATLDWLLPENDVVQHVRTTGSEVKVTPLNLPDTGTVFEMGYAYSYGRPIFGLTYRPVGDRLNLMLTQSCKAVIYGLDQLRGFMSSVKTGVAGDISWDRTIIGGWKGEHR